MVVSFIHSLIQRIMADGIGIAQRSQNPPLYPYFLAAIGASVVLGIANFVLTILVRPRGKRRVARVLWIELKFLFRRELLQLYCLWLAFATPYYLLPVPPPSADRGWLVALYSVVAVGLHGALSFYGAGLVLGWLTQLHTPNQSRIDTLCVICTYAAIIYGWEAQHWPELYLILAELMMVFLLAGFLVSLVFGPKHVGVPLTRWQVIFGFPLVIAGSLVVQLTHQVTNPFLNLAWIFFTFTTVDTWYLICRGRDTFRRSLPLFALMLGCTIVLCSGVLQSIMMNSGITYEIWLEAGTAAAAYMLFWPLTEFARNAAGKLVVRQAVVDVGFMDADQPLQLDGPVVESEPSTQSSSTASAPKSRAPKTVVQAQGQRSALAHLKRAADEAEAVSKALKFRAGIILLVLLLIYHQIALSVNIFSALNGNLVTLLFGIISIFVGIIALASGPAIAPAKSVLILLLLVSMCVMALGLLLNFSPVATSQLAPLTAPPLTTLTDQHFLLVTLRGMAQELLMLLALGQVVYLFIIILASLSGFTPTGLSES